MRKRLTLVIIIVLAAVVCLWAVQLASDAFTRANENPLAGNWTTVPSSLNLKLLSNAVQQADTTADHHVSYYNAVVWPNDQYSEVKLITCAASCFPGAAVRASAAANTYYLGFLFNGFGAGQSCWIAKRVAGAQTTLSTGDTTATWATTDLIYIEAQGTTLKCKHNSTVVSTITDSSIASGNAGIMIEDDAGTPTATIDDWDGGNFSAGGTRQPRHRGGFISAIFGIETAYAQSLPGRFYFIPTQGTGTSTDPRRPKYLDGKSYSAMDDGFEPQMLVYGEFDAATDTALTANSDVTAVPVNLDQTLSAGAVNTVQTALENRNIPAGWISTALTYRQVLRTIAGFFRFFQRFNAIHGNVRVLATGTLDLTVSQMPVSVRTDLAATADSLGFDRSAVTGATTVRALLKGMADQFGATPVQIGNGLI